MTTSRRVEVLCGMLSALLAVIVLCTMLRPTSFSQFLQAIPFYLGPALLVAVGSYVHAIGRKKSGFVILVIGGSILTLGMLLAIFGGAFYVYGLWGGLFGITPHVLAILTMIASLVARR